MSEKLKKMQRLISLVLLVLMVVGLFLIGPGQQKRPEFAGAPQFVAIIFVTVMMLGSIYVVYPLRYYDTYITRVVRSKRLTINDVAKITQIDRKNFKVRDEMTGDITVKWKYLHEAAEKLEQYYLANH